MSREFFCYCCLDVLGHTKNNSNTITNSKPITLKNSYSTSKKVIKGDGAGGQKIDENVSSTIIRIASNALLCCCFYQLKK